MLETSLILLASSAIGTCSFKVDCQDKETLPRQLARVRLQPLSELLVESDRLGCDKLSGRCSDTDRTRSKLVWRESPLVLEINPCAFSLGSRPDERDRVPVNLFLMELIRFLFFNLPRRYGAGISESFEVMLAVPMLSLPSSLLSSLLVLLPGRS